MDVLARIWIAGEETFIGQALRRVLERSGYRTVIPPGGVVLTDESQVRNFFTEAKPEYIFLVGGKSGGIRANQKYPADFALDNLAVTCNVITAALRFRTRKLLYLANSCVYPKHCPQPMRPESLLSGKLEPTNEAYAVAKLAGITLVQACREQYGADFIAVIPANPFGPGEDFDREDSHVIPALIRKMHEAKVRHEASLEIWGTGAPRRDFIFVDDLARGCLFAMQNYSDLAPINIGSGTGISIRELALMVQEVVGFAGEIRFDSSKPDGMPVKLLDSSTVNAMGWQLKTELSEAIGVTYRWFLEQGGS